MSLWTTPESCTAQKQRIDQLINDIRFMQSDVERLSCDLLVMRPKAEFYLTVQRRVIKDQAAQDAMQRFLMVMRLTLPDDIRGFTTQ